MKLNLKYYNTAVLIVHIYVTHACAQKYSSQLHSLVNCILSKSSIPTRQMTKIATKPTWLYTF